MTHSSFRLSIKWKKNFPSLTGQELRTGLLTTVDSTTKLISMFLNWPAMIWLLPPTVPLKVVMVVIFTPSHSFPRITGGPAFPPMSVNMSLAAQFARHTKSSSISWSQLSPLLPSNAITPSRTSLLISSPTSLQSEVSILSWLWSTMALVRG